MSVFSYKYQEAADNFRDGIHARWSSKDEQRLGKEYMTERLGEIFHPGVTVHTPIQKTDSIFTVGSCFARGLEGAAHRAGMIALSRRTQRFLGADVLAGYVNRYNTSSILNELRWASGVPYDDGNYVPRPNDKFIDPHSHPVIGAVSIDEARRLRAGLKSYFEQIFKADVITITLGLIEGWFDLETGLMLNLNPVYGRDDQAGRRIVHGDRFEFRVMSHDENMANLDEIYALLKRLNPNVKLFVSVSPVPLSATFSHRDVAVANMLSKSMLRSCAETWVGRYPDIQYFPSYEMAMLSNRVRVFKEDGIHIQPEFVDAIMAHFMNTCVTPASVDTKPAELAQS